MGGNSSSNALAGKGWLNKKPCASSHSRVRGESELFRGFNPFSEYALFEALSHADHGTDDVCTIGVAA